MSHNIRQAKEAIRQLRALRDAGKKEAALRSHFLTCLSRIFPERVDQGWIDHYGEGTEARTVVGQTGGTTANRFIDNLIGSTTIEYEIDLRIAARREGGMSQVREHVAGLVRDGCPVHQVRGILSDTVEWEAFDAELINSVSPIECTPEDIKLIPVESLNLSKDDDSAAERLIAFLRKHLAREQSRPLKADYLVLDLGLDSRTCQMSAGPLCRLVEEGRAANESIRMATDLWSSFVDYLEGEEGAFRVAAYVDEVYLCVLSRLLGANVLAGYALSSDDQELAAILNGAYFEEEYRLANMVEQDYFGWVIGPAYIGRLKPIARQIQQDLYAYDFSWRPDDDLFGRLMAQLAGRCERKLLGQEWTPRWLARLLAERCLDNLPKGEQPRIIDICCGSGSFLIEILKAARSRFHLDSISDLQGVATGFDIDPLAVSLSKTTWVVTLADQIKAASDPIVIPIYHADSLFSVTPITPSLPLLGEDDIIPLVLDGSRINLPNALVQPANRALFDRIIDWAYDEALEAQEMGSTAQLSESGAAQFLDGAVTALGIQLGAALKRTLVPVLFALALRMAELAVAGRNGIWAFILRNTYRPGLLAGRFNGLVSNPPWLAMSSLGNNPYRQILT